ncbi:hypothetical protein SHI21_01255 [Bacteriovorax sp. PP10]|uniref:Uncharacterized protein n=1 Tax=Bacteriovorax antarcticus TaxID=3088717 RepID=A0ABU5VR14_9BACT|nr:hypothetical protein [Bacteriovorax sp. PP10]MEA9354809.1 hypothetical protein [Bacteriovorax sp. PP10]
MMNKSIFVKTFTCLFTTTLVVGALTYSTDRYEPKKVDFSAFKNAAANIQHLSQKTEIKADVVRTDVTAGIVSTIEKEIKSKILRTRYAMVPKKVEFKHAVIAKNWNDIKPEIAAVDMTISDRLMNTNSTDESGSEINNNELIKLYGYEVDSLQYETFANTLIASVDPVATEVVGVTEATSKQEIVKEDAVNVAQASTTTHVVEEITVDAAMKEEIARAEVATKENPVNDDLVMFDYSAAGEKETAPVANTQKLKKIFDAPISASVKGAIERAVHKSPMVAMNTQSAPSKRIASSIETTTETDALEQAMADEDNLVFDYSKKTQASVAKTTASEISAFMAAADAAPANQVDFTVKAREINLATRKSTQVLGFEFVPDYDRAERMDDQTSGEIKLAYSLAGDVSTQTGVIQAQGLIPTRVELNLLTSGIEVPLLSEEGIQRFLSKKQTGVTGNLLMVAVDPSIADVEIDSEYQYKLFFSDKFKMQQNQDNAAYVLFLGVKTGNTLIRYLLDNKESAQKIVYVGDGEMYFEDPDFVGTQRELYTFTTRSLLGKTVKELNINGTDVSFFGTKITAKKKTLNAYEIKVPELVDNSRKYLEFKHMGTSLFVGTKNTKEIEIPGQDFINRVMQANELSELGERCMVQINLKKDLRDIKVSGKNRSGEMFAETSFLDTEGNFTRDSSELAEKAFVSGDLEGIFSVRLDYADGTTDFLKTFCSEGAYLIEQL